MRKALCVAGNPETIHICKCQGTHVFPHLTHKVPHVYLPARIFAVQNEVCRFGCQSWAWTTASQDNFMVLFRTPTSDFSSTLNSLLCPSPALALVADHAYPLSSVSRLSHSHALSQTLAFSLSLCAVGKPPEEGEVPGRLPPAPSFVTLLPGS